MLKLQSTEPEWLDILGARILFSPITIKTVRAAREAVRDALGLDDTDLQGAGDALSREMIRRGILDWEGVGDKAGTPIAVTPESVEAFIADPNAYEAADRAYVRPWANRDIEGNVSAGSPNGTGAAETPADDIAPSAARPKRKAGAMTKKRGRRSAPTSSTSRRPTKASSSGTS